MAGLVGDHAGVFELVAVKLADGVEFYGQLNKQVNQKDGNDGYDVVRINNGDCQEVEEVGVLEAVRVGVGARGGPGGLGLGYRVGKPGVQVMGPELLGLVQIQKNLKGGALEYQGYEVVTGLDHVEILSKLQDVPLLN